MLDNLILKSICESPLLIAQLPEASPFERCELFPKAPTASLNLEQKLGHLYEDALALLLESSTRYQVLEQSLQLQDGVHQTLGELDFLLGDKQTGELIHLELAIKFYLALETPHGLQLPGPDARDNYFKKLHRLRTHQLILTQKYRDYLPKGYRNQAIKSQHLILGCLFEHITSAQPAKADFLNPQARRGHWVHQSEFHQHFSNYSCQIIPKALWPVNLSELDSNQFPPFTGSSPLERCVLLKIEDHPKPVFVTPEQYPFTSG